MERKLAAGERLLIEAAQKNPERFADLYEIHVDRVYAYIVRRVRDRAAAEDLTSEVFHEALANLGRYEWRGLPFAAWLYRIADHAMADRWQRSSREAGTAGTEDPGFQEGTERRAMLSQLIDSLPAEQKRVILERFVEQRSIREIAQALGRTEGAVKQLQFRAIETLRTRLGVKNG